MKRTAFAIFSLAALLTATGCQSTGTSHSSAPVHSEPVFAPTEQNFSSSYASGYNHAASAQTAYGGGQMLAGDYRNSSPHVPQSAALAEWNATSPGIGTPAKQHSGYYQQRGITRQVQWQTNMPGTSINGYTPAPRQAIQPAGGSGNC